MGKYCVWYQNRSLGRWPVNHIRSQARGITSTTGCIGESGFDPVELWVMGPPCGLKEGKALFILNGHDSKACQRVPCQLCRQQRWYLGRGTKRTIFLLVERGEPIGKVLVHRWLPECHQQKEQGLTDRIVHRGVYISRELSLLRYFRLPERLNKTMERKV